MRISLIGPTHPFKGGIAHHTTLLFRHLRERHDVSFYAFSRGYPAWLFPGDTIVDRSHAPIQENGVHYSLDYLNPKSWLDVSKQISALNPDLVIFPWWVVFWTPVYLSMVSLIKRRIRARILSICHNVVSHEDRFLDRWCTATVLRRTDYCFVHSAEEQEKLKCLLPGVRSFLVHHPIYDIFSFNDVTKGEARKRLGIEGRWILFFGFVRPYKGLRYLIEAMPIVLKELEANLMVVGEFWESFERYRSLAAQLGVGKNIRFVNRYVPNEEVEIYFRACDVVVAPYVSTTGSGIVQLAYGLGKSIIATNVGAFREVVQEGLTGYLVQPCDSASLAAAIVEFYRENKEEEFARNNKDYSSRFSWGKIVEAIEALASRDAVVNSGS